MSILEETEKTKCLLLENDIKINRILEILGIKLATNTGFKKEFHSTEQESIIIEYIRYRMLCDGLVLNLKFQEEISEFLIEIVQDNELQSNVENMSKELFKMRKIASIIRKHTAIVNNGCIHFHQGAQSTKARTNCDYKPELFPFLTRDRYDFLVVSLKNVLTECNQIKNHRQVLIELLDRNFTEKTILELFLNRIRELNVEFEYFQRIFFRYLKQNETKNNERVKILELYLQIMMELVSDESNLHYDALIEHFDTFPKHIAVNILSIYNKWLFSEAFKIKNTEIILNDASIETKLNIIERKILDKHGSNIWHHINNILKMMNGLVSVRNKVFTVTCKCLLLIFPQMVHKISLKTTSVLIAAKEDIDTKIVFFIIASRCKHKREYLYQKVSDDIIYSISKKMRFFIFDHELVISLKLYDILMPKILLKDEYSKRIALLEMLLIILNHDTNLHELHKISLKIIAKLILIDEKSRDFFVERQVYTLIKQKMESFRQESLLTFLNYSYHSTFQEKKEILNAIVPIIEEKKEYSIVEMQLIFGLLQNLLCCNSQEKNVILEKISSQSELVVSLAKSLEFAVKNNQKGVIATILYILSNLFKDLNFTHIDLFNFDQVRSIADTEIRIAMLSLFINMTFNYTSFVNKNCVLLRQITDLLYVIIKDENIPNYMKNILLKNLDVIKRKNKMIK